MQQKRFKNPCPKQKNRWSNQYLFLLKLSINTELSILLVLLAVLICIIFLINLILFSLYFFLGELCSSHDSYSEADGRLSLQPSDQHLREDKERCGGEFILIEESMSETCKPISFLHVHCCRGWLHSRDLIKQSTEHCMEHFYIPFVVKVLWRFITL